MDSWIFCEDELPDKSGDYLVLWATNKYKTIFYEIQEFCNGGWCINIPQAYGEVKIIAWQELPVIPEELKNE